MNLAVRTTCPVRVTSLTSTTPRAVETSRRRPAFVATISKSFVPLPVSTVISTRSPLMGRILLPRALRILGGAPGRRSGRTRSLRREKPCSFPNGGPTRGQLRQDRPGLGGLPTERQRQLDRAGVHHGP